MPTTKLWLAIIHDSNKTEESAMAFMQRQITGRQNWLRVETTHGTEFVNVFDTGLDLPASSNLADGVTEDNSSDVQRYCEGKVQSWENIEGYGARLSAPGYLDCTEWNVYDTEQEAREALEEMYPEAVFYDEEEGDDEG
jgi:hypothetical protein